MRRIVQLLNYRYVISALNSLPGLIKKGAGIYGVISKSNQKKS